MDRGCWLEAEPLPVCSCKVCFLPCRTTLACTPGLHKRLLEILKPKTECLIQQGYPLGTWYVPEVYEQYVKQASSQQQ